MPDVDLTLTFDFKPLLVPLARTEQLIETELADLSLKQGLFGSLVSSDLARTVAWTMVSMVHLSLEAGDLRQFQRQIEWEIRVALHHHQLFKLESDLVLLGLLKEIMLKHFDTVYSVQVAHFMTQLETLFRNCWQQAALQWEREHRSS